MELRRPDPLDFHGAIDGRLAAGREAALSQWLASCPQEAQRLSGWSRDMARLRAAFDPILDEALPASLLPPNRPFRAPAQERQGPAHGRSGTTAGSLSARPARRRLAAVAVGSFCLGGATALAGAALLTRLSPPQGGVVAAILQAVSRLLP